MNPTIQKTKPSFLEAGLPCSSLSAECQRDNNARQRPPQNRLHIWWARRPPTICRAAILAGLLPHYLELDNAVLPPMIPEPTENDLEDLSTKLRPLRHFFEHLLSQVPATSLTRAHQDFLRSMGITGDVDRAYRRLALAEGANDGKDIILGSTWGYRHQRAFGISPSETLIETLLRETRSYLNLPSNQPIVILDGMAGGGVIPLEGIRYGFKVFANDLNPVAATILKATTEYPAHFGESLSTTIEKYAREVYAAAKARLLPFFPFQPADEWWLEEKDNARRKFSARSIVCLEPAMGVDAIKNTYLWCRTIPCPRCSLNIPLSTNFYIVKPKGKPQDEIAAFPEVPPLSLGNDCTFRIVKRPEWEICIWPKPGFTRWHPNGDIPPNGKTPRCDGFTFKDGNAYCPRCGHVIDGEDVKASACAHGGGLAAQMYAVCSQVPVRLTYRNGDVKVRYLWRFRPPTQADLDAVKAAEVELARLLPQWEAKDLIPTESMPENMEDKRPREYGMSRWRDLFLPRQLLTNVVILEEIWNAQERIRAELPADKAEAVSVYLALML